MITKKVDATIGGLINHEVPVMLEKGFEINFDTPVITSSVKLTVLDVYKGAYYSDLAISEISFK